MKKVLHDSLRVMREVHQRFFRRNRVRWKADPITRYVGLFQSKDNDLSARHDDYLYDNGLAASSLEP